MAYYNKVIYIENYHKPEYKINTKMSQHFRGKASIFSISRNKSESL